MGYGTKRFQFDVAGSDAAHLEQLKATTGLNTNQKLFDEALTLLDWAVAQAKEGRIIASIDEQNQVYRELAMPALRKVRQQQEEAGTTVPAEV